MKKVSKCDLITLMADNLTAKLIPLRYQHFLVSISTQIGQVAG